MLLILSTLRIVDLGDMIAEINTIKVILLTITTTITIMAVSHGEERVMFMKKRVVALVSI